MASFDMMELWSTLLGAIAVASIAYALAYPYISGEKHVEKRMQSATENRSKRTARVAQVEQTNSRRKAVSDTLKELEDRQKAKEKVTLRVRLQRAGLNVSTNSYWISCGVCGAVLGITTLVLMPNLPPIATAAVAFIGAFGLPRWWLNMLTKRRQAKFLGEFANAMDVIVRGVKSGLPFNECLNIIARESPSPIKEEFVDLVEQQRVGVPFTECFDRMIQRMPLPEVKFFGIVVSIQQQAGGNLSEALGNLSGVLRDRKMMKAKVQALSSEAKASAYVLGSLPFIVTLMVYMATPAYISILWTTKSGVFSLMMSGLLMSAGIFVMKKMINFKF